MKDYLSRDQLRLYKLMRERFMASQMAPAVIDTVAVDLTQGNIKFRANGQTIKFKGFMSVYIEGHDDAEEEGKTDYLNLRSAIKFRRQISLKINTLLSPRHDIPRHVSSRHLRRRASVDLLLMHRHLIRFRSVTT